MKGQVKNRKQQQLILDTCRRAKGVRHVINDIEIVPTAAEQLPRTATLRIDGIVFASDNKLVLISVGADDGIRVGTTLDVYRANAYLGRIEVRRLEPDGAVAAILGEYGRGTISRGDRVVTTQSQPAISR